MFVAFDSLKDALGPFLCFLQVVMQKVPPPFLTLFFVSICLCAIGATSYIVTALFIFCVFSRSFGIGWLWVKWRVQHWRILVTVQANRLQRQSKCAVVWMRAEAQRVTNDVVYFDIL